MSDQTTALLTADSVGIARAVDLLRAGEVVAFPTETVYGLGADARNGKAIARVYAAKDRPRFNPLIVHVPDVATARDLAHFSEAAETLATAFWPGPLSMVLPLKEGHGLSELVTAGLDTVALRLPAHPLARTLLSEVGPVAAPSANPSGRISPTNAQHVLAGLFGRIAAVLDGGDSDVGLESTIADPDTPRLLRPGGVSLEDLERILGRRILNKLDGKINAPGQLASHYAPQAAVRLEAGSKHAGEVHLGFGHITGDINLSPSGNLAEAAANLFKALHALDADGRPIAVAPIPDTGLGAAINDRLRRAAAPR